MKKLLICLALSLLVTAALLLPAAGMADTSSVCRIESPSDLAAALEDPDYSEVIVTGDGEITDSFLTLTKNVTFLGNVAFHPDPDPDSFYVRASASRRGSP